MEMDATTVTEQHTGQQQKPVNKQLDNGFVLDGSGNGRGKMSLAGDVEPD
jgi:hypothetical protein